MAEDVAGPENLRLLGTATALITVMELTDKMTWPKRSNLLKRKPQRKQLQKHLRSLMSLVKQRRATVGARRDAGAVAHRVASTGSR